MVQVEELVVAPDNILLFAIDGLRHGELFEAAFDAGK